ncbi:hypothetical protein [Bradyrhizobium sp. CCGUVB23]|uniref:hypothetical protein n=1 Tax=Bradyrhizobium sp. CCGUVB23 TaxID=2949630 RepID=UPI0020B39A8D|nr:hypothetical protein [Bradyrhizobium sp. CCGUVB23]MCP3463324.1 hypothetical protein [Bradyrhizobium sp. CCGUVB23]
MFSTDLERAVASFRARSPERDAEIDEKRVSSIEISIEAAARELLAERTGLVARLKRVLDEPNRFARWSFARKPRISDAEFLRVEKRLKVLDAQLSECQRLKEAVSHLRALTDCLKA